jgi:hypothetical protein
MQRTLLLGPVAQMKFCTNFDLNLSSVGGISGLHAKIDFDAKMPAQVFLAPLHTYILLYIHFSLGTDAMITNDPHDLVAVVNEPDYRGIPFPEDTRTRAISPWLLLQTSKYFITRGYLVYNRSIMALPGSVHTNELG